MDAILNWVWQGIVVAAALLLMLRAITGVRANVRYVVCGVALSIVLTIPAIWPLSSTRVLRQHAAQSSASPLIPVPATPWTSGAAMLGLGLLWAAAQGLSVSRDLIRLHRARHAFRPFPIDLERRLHHWMRLRGERRHARLVLSDDVALAAVLGCGTPLIAISSALIERLSADELDYVIIHEWAHVQRRDDIANFLLVAVRLVAGWHPAVRWIDRRLQIEREAACDEIAVAIAGSRKSYANCLVKLSDLSAVRAVSLLATGVLGADGLRYRVTRILSYGPLSSPVWSRSLGTAVVAALLTVVIGIGGLELFATVTTAQLPTTTAVSPPVQAMPTRRLSIEPIRKAEEKQESIGIMLPQDQGVTGGRSQTIETPRTEESSQWPSDAQSNEPAEPPITLETPAAAADTLTLAAAASIPGTASSSEGDSHADSRSPWAAAGDAGIAIGRHSKAAGVATGGVFTRFARRIAGSF